MRYLKSYSEQNESLKNTIASVGLAGSLLMGGVDTKANVTYDVQSSIQSSVPRDGVEVRKMVIELSNKRSTQTKDDSLNLILDEIKLNLDSNDSSKLLNSFSKLSTHIEQQYGYKILTQDINDINQEKVEEMKKDPSEGTLFYILGWLGSVCLALCGVPQAMQSYKEKHSDGISWGFLLLWAFGEIFALLYVFDKLDMPLLMNYAANILIVGVMLYYKIKPQSTLED